MMSIKTVNALSHYTDWTVGHVHAGALGWVGLISMGSLYYLIPRLFGRTQMYSVPAIDAALLDRDHRHRALHRRDVDRRRDAGPDVARGQRRRHADLHLRRERQGDLSRSTWSASSAALLYLAGMLRDGLEHLDDRAPAARRAPPRSPLPAPPIA